MSELTVRWRHIQAARLCSRGARKWFTDRGLDWNDFLKNGIAAQTLSDLEDALADRVVKVASNEKEGS